MNNYEKLKAETRLPAQLKGVRVKLKNDEPWNGCVVKAGSDGIVFAYAQSWDHGFFSTTITENKKGYLIELPIFEEMIFTGKTGSVKFNSYVYSMGSVGLTMPEYFAVAVDDVIWPEESIQYLGK